MSTVDAVPAVAPARRRILSVDKARRGESVFLLCCWSDCERDGVELHKVRFHDHNRALPCDHGLAQHVWYVFCSERHRQFFLNAHRKDGFLPTGERGLIS